MAKGIFTTKVDPPYDDIPVISDLHKKVCELVEVPSSAYKNLGSIRISQTNLMNNYYTLKESSRKSTCARMDPYQARRSKS